MNGFFSHLEALRRMLLEVLAIFVLLLIPGWYWAAEIIAVLQHYAASGLETQFSLRYFALMEPFVVEFKTGVLLALGAGMPLYFWRIWHFLAPALYRHERRWLAGGALAAWGLFMAGVCLALFAVVPLLLRFSLSFARTGLEPLIGVENFVMLILTICLAFGVMFEFPLLLLLLLLLGVIRLDTLCRQRPTVLVIILVLAAILTPPDVLSQVMLAVPCYLLFELTLLVARFLPRPPESPEPESEPPVEPLPEVYQAAERRALRRRSRPPRRGPYFRR